MQANDIAYEFHDYKKSGIDKKSLTQWSKELGWENLLNKRGTTWRKLPEDQKSDLTQTRAIELLLENTSMIKRPVVSVNGNLLLGFDEASWSSTFGID
jgi:Spx/MgsR family transcriptional regulator